MIALLRKLNDVQETILVIAVGLGLFIYWSIYWLVLVSGDPSGWTYAYDLQDSLLMFVIELVLLTAVAFILSSRGWRLSEIPIKFSWGALSQSIGLLILTVLMLVIVNSVTAAIGIMYFDGDMDAFSRDNGLVVKMHHNYWIWVPVYLLNSCFEEFLYIGYLFRKMEKKNRWLFYTVSSTLRTTIHLYQGLSAIPFHFVFGFIFSSFYAKRRNLLPLIITHTLWNLIHLLMN